MKIRTYSQQASRKAIEDSVATLYKKAQLFEGHEEEMSSVMISLSKAFGMEITKEEAREVMSFVDDIAAALGITLDDLKVALKKVADVAEGIFNKIMGMLSSKQDDSSETLLLENNAEDGALATGFKVLKTIVPKTKRIYNYLFKSDASKIKKVLGTGIALALSLGYIVSPVDLIPDIIPIIGWGDDLVSFIFIGDVVYGLIDSNYKSDDSQEVAQEEVAEELETTELPDEPITIDVEFEDLDKESLELIKELIKVSNNLDAKGLTKLADEADSLLKKLL